MRKEKKLPSHAKATSYTWQKTIASIFLLGLVAYTLLQSHSPLDGHASARASSASSTVGTRYLYYVLKEPGGFVLARSQAGTSDQPSAAPRVVASFGSFGQTSSDGIISLQPSPDGRYLAIDGTHSDGELVWIFDTQRLRLNVQPANVGGTFLHWLPGPSETFLYRPMFPRGPGAPLSGGSWNPGLWKVNAVTGGVTNLDIHAPSASLIDAVPSPDGAQILYSTSAGMGMGSDLWTMDASGQDRTHLLNVSDTVQSIAGMLAWSPDGQTIAYERLADSPTPFLPAGLWLMDRQGKTQHFLAQADGGHNFALLWSPNGQQIAFVARTNPAESMADQSTQRLQSAVEVVNINNGRSWTVAGPAQTGVQINANPTWSADSSRITLTAFNPLNPRLGGTVHYWSVSAHPTRSVPGSAQLPQSVSHVIALSAATLTGAPARWTLQAKPGAQPGPSPLNGVQAQLPKNPGPFIHLPYYGSSKLQTRVTSYFDHDEPWYANDNIFVRYDGKRWTGPNVSVLNCDPGITCYDGHNGYDLQLQFEPVLSAAAGKVIRAGWYTAQNHDDSFGLWAAIDHGNGFATVYGHLSALTVTVGQHVGTQWQIGTSGTTGASTGPHLHFGTYFYPSWQATDPSGWQGNYADPNIVPDYSLWTQGTNNTPVPLLGNQGKTLAPGAILVDDRSPGWSSRGQWNGARASTDINGSLHWTTTTSGPATATATWQAQLPAPGYYEVGTFVDDNHASSGWASYTVYSNDPVYHTVVAHQVKVDQEHIGNFQNAFGNVNTGAQWIGLGTYYFTGAQPARVVLSNATGEDGLQLAADAVQFAPLAPVVFNFAFTADNTPAHMIANASLTINLTLRNTSNFPWRAQGQDAVQLVYRWLDGQGHVVSTSQPFTLTRDLAIRASEPLAIKVQAPGQAGTYTLQWDLVQGQRVFSKLGAQPKDDSVSVLGPAPIPTPTPGPSPTSSPGPVGTSH